MKEISLPDGHIALVDDDDYMRLAQYCWCAKKAPRAGGRVTWYVHRNVKRDGRWTTVLMHREILVGAEQVDHRDGDGLNNQKYNLRTASQFQNLGNQAKAVGKSSRFKGVSWSKQHSKWRAIFSGGGVRRHLGYFKEEFDAALAYNVVAEVVLGVYAKLNVPDGCA